MTSLPPPDVLTYDNALSALLSPLHQSQTPDDIKEASQRRTKTPSDMRRYLSRISLPHDSNKHCKNIVHITGTKGKGSTAAICESVLRKRDGLTTGLFTSPHLVDIRERIRIDGKPVSTKVFGDAYWEIRRRFEEWKQSTNDDDDDDHDGLPYLPGYFRMLALMATLIFAHYETAEDNRIDVMILEVGVGGRYDATNIFDHSTTNTVCGVTLIDYDHTRVLGSSLSQIAWEKAGVFHTNKEDIVDVFAENFDDSQHNITIRPSSDTSGVDVRKDISSLTNINPNEATRFFTIESNPDKILNVLSLCAYKEGNGQTLGVVKKGDKVQPEWKIGLPGDHQRINAELAVALCNALTKNVDRQGIGRSTQLSLQEALGQTFWPGRCQSVSMKSDDGKTMNVRCDGAHTPQSLATCLEFFRTVSGYDDGTKRARFLIFNCSHERNPVPLLDMIQSIDQPRNAGGDGGEQYRKPLFDQVYFCRADSERPSALKKASAQELLIDAGILEDIDEAVEETEALEQEEQEIEAKTWQDTLANVWMVLAARKSGAGLQEVPCVVNVNVGDALAIIKHCMNTDPRKKFHVDDEGEVEICVTGSLYMVGSALNAADWSEASSNGTLQWSSASVMSK